MFRGCSPVPGNSRLSVLLVARLDGYCKGVSGLDTKVAPCACAAPYRRTLSLFSEKVGAGLALTVSVVVSTPPLSVRETEKSPELSADAGL